MVLAECNSQLVANLPQQVLAPQDVVVFNVIGTEAIHYAQDCSPLFRLGENHFSRIGCRTKKNGTHVYWLAILADKGTYTAAAAVRLGVSKSAVSQRIVELEKATGLRLVLRTARRDSRLSAEVRLASTPGGSRRT